jgi:hypothetical protein
VATSGGAVTWTDRAVVLADIHGATPERDCRAARRHDVPRQLRFFSIYSGTHYAAGDHMDR